MVDSFPVDMKKLHSRDFKEWATEGYTNSVSQVYPGFVVNESPSIGYKTNAENVCRSRIMYGGRRLADLLTHIFTNDSSFLQ
jgi:hypothetical protein